jgi:hypothetical protein
MNVYKNIGLMVATKKKDNSQVHNHTVVCTLGPTNTGYFFQLGNGPTVAPSTTHNILVSIAICGILPIFHFVFSRFCEFLLTVVAPRPDYR